MSRYRAGLSAALLALSLAACGEAPEALSPDVSHPSRAAMPSELSQQLAELRRATAPFHRLQAAAAAGYGLQLTQCMDHPPQGGMGYHIGNGALIDGSASPAEPEVLLYEPQKNGEMRLVGVEYIIPYTERARSADPPVLFGQEFKRNDVFQLWALHVWIWHENPNGLFSDWNPRISCAHA